MVKVLARDHPETGYKLKKLEVKKTTGRPSFESQEEGLHEAIFLVVLPESTADERCKIETFNSVRSLDDLNKAFGKKKRFPFEQNCYLLPAFTGFYFFL